MRHVKSRALRAAVFLISAIVLLAQGAAAQPAPAHWLSGPEAAACTETGAAEATCGEALRVGVRTDYAGFSEADASGQLSGFEIDAALALAERLGRDITFVPVTADSRLSALNAGEVDLVVAAIGHTTGRDPVVRLLRSHYFESSTAIVGPRDEALPAAGGLGTLTICTTSGNYAIPTLSAEAGRLVLFADVASLFDALDAGRCRFAAQDDVLVERRLAERADLSERFEIKQRFLPIPWAMALRRDTAPAEVQVHEAALQDLHRSGTLITSALRHGLPTGFLEAARRDWSEEHCIASPDDCLGTPLPTAVEMRVAVMADAPSRHAGLYVAETMGLYAAENVGVRFQNTPVDQSPLDALVEGRADVAVAWLGDAIEAHGQGADILNVAQIFERSMTRLVCKRESGIAVLQDLSGKRIGTTARGTETNLRIWLAVNGVGPDRVNLVRATPEVLADFGGSALDCLSISDPARFEGLVRTADAASLVVFTKANLPGSLPEDGIYIRADTLTDPARRLAVERFLRASLQGWRLLRQDETMVAGIAPMLEESGNPGTLSETRTALSGALGKDAELGLLSPNALKLSWEALSLTRPEDRGPDDAGPDAAEALHAPYAMATQSVWYAAHPEADGLLRPRHATVTHVAEITKSQWFFTVYMVFVFSYGLSGFMRGRERGYDLWGVFVCTMLPAVGGSVFRDLLVGGDRLPLFIFTKPAFVYVPMAALGTGYAAVFLLKRYAHRKSDLDKFKLFTDALGFSALAVIGTNVAIVAELNWYWAPVCAAISCAGGGMLLDVVTGREPKTFRGEFYEELAILGSLLLLVLLKICDQFEGEQWLVVLSICATMVLIFVTRVTLVLSGAQARMRARFAVRTGETGARGA